MAQPKVWERWRCRDCSAEQDRPYRTLAYTRRHGRELPCDCNGRQEPWPRHDYVCDAAEPSALRERP